MKIHTAALAAALAAFWCATAAAQNSSLFLEDIPPGQRGPLLLQQGSWMYTPVPEPQRVQLHDTIVVRVDELARMTSEGDMDRRKDASYDVILQDWVHLIGLKALKPDVQRDGDQRIRGQLQQLFRAEGDMETRESLAFNIACSVVDIRPNGTLVLEGHRQIRVNDESWQLSLSGVCRREDVGPDNVILSRNIAELLINKTERGHVRDAYRRGWFVRLFDEFDPF